MANSVPLYVIDAFTCERFTGNPAGVVFEADRLDDSQMQRIARELGHSETAFVLSSRDDSHDLWIRYFTPRVEIPVCGHATIAAHFARHLRRETGTHCRQLSGIGVLDIEISAQGEVVMKQGTPELGPILDASIRERVCQALHISVAELDSRLPLRTASTGGPKLMIPLREESCLHSLRPDLPAIAALADSVGATGFYPFVIETQGWPTQSEARLFAPSVGIAEDPVTGIAAGAFGAYLVAHFRPGDGIHRVRARQGQAIGRPGFVDVEVTVTGGRPAEARVRGVAVLVHEGRLWLD